MHIGVLQISFRIPENGSLKGKRKALSSITARVRNKFNVSVAEVDDYELWQLATLGIVCASNDSSHADETLSKVVNFVEASREDLEMVDYSLEVLNGL